MRCVYQEDVQLYFKLVDLSVGGCATLYSNICNLYSIFNTLYSILGTHYSVLNPPYLIPYSILCSLNHVFFNLPNVPSFLVFSHCPPDSTGDSVRPGHYIILNNRILKSNSLIFPRSEGYITQYTPSGFALGNSFRQRVIFDSISLVSS